MQPPKSFLFTMEDYVRDSFRGKEVIYVILQIKHLLQKRKHYMNLRNSMAGLNCGVFFERITFHAMSMLSGKMIWKWNLGIGALNRFDGVYSEEFGEHFGI